MPFCTACGASVAEPAAFCSACGQGVAPAAPPSPVPSSADGQVPLPLPPGKKKTHPLVWGCAIALGIFVVIPLFLLIVGIVVGTMTEPSENRTASAQTEQVMATDSEPEPEPVKPGARPSEGNRSGPSTEKKTAPATAAASKIEPPAPPAQDKISQAAKPNPKERRRLRREIKALVQRGRAMENLRQGQSLAALRRCGDQMRAAQAQARTVHQQAQALEKNARYPGLSTAANMVSLCVSCMTSAQSTCDDVEDQLRTEKEINK